ncbi:hypothetical protein V6N11_018183 [Hibiscus sabdariffa]|uniref:Uncharacterized protein n=1 Tax=Hibiscus sabdariffa TaxID=183260 RepID=A0ABR2T6L6_9ROSI
MFPTNHLISVHVAVKIPAPNRFGYPYAYSCVENKFASELQLLEALFHLQCQWQFSRPYLQSMSPTNLFSVYESSSDHPNLVWSCNLCCNIDAYEMICW